MLKALGDLIDKFFGSLNALFVKAGDEANKDLDDLEGHGLLIERPPFDPKDLLPANWLDPVPSSYPRASRPIAFDRAEIELDPRRPDEDLKAGR